jgi:phenylpyruvate tautomerase PptA (4-oxalocrotonate tautomerase family)
MPTITVESTALSPRLHREFAKRVSLWLRGQGVDLNHVITKFVVADPRHVFSGPFPLAADDATVFAFVRCSVDAARTADFRRSMAAEIVLALRAAIPPERTFIQFEDVQKAKHFIGTDALQEGQP